jgi:CheY-like chemotaxis protein
MKSFYALTLPRIFIIDNSLADCRFMSKSLSRAGYRANFATDGQEGLTSILQNPPHCLIINVLLPQLSSYAICRHIRTLYPSNTLPIIAIGTKNTLLDQNYSSKTGINYYLSKPFSEDVLLQTVQKMLPDFSPISMMSPIAPTPIPQSITPKEPIYPLISTLIPYRQDEIDIMLQNNPFARASIIKDGQLRHLYALIDGDKTIQELAQLMHLDLQSILKFLKALWKQQHIAFYDAKRHPFNDMSLFDNIT